MPAHPPRGDVVDNEYAVGLLVVGGDGVLVLVLPRRVPNLKLHPRVVVVNGTDLKQGG